MEQKIERKGRNPRITVCYTPDENEKIVRLATACGLKKSQYVHDTSLGQEPKVMMSDKEADALMSLKAARGELVLIKERPSWHYPGTAKEILPQRAVHEAVD